MESLKFEPSDTEQIFNRLKTIFSREKGYFGHIDSWMQHKEKYIDVGFLISDKMLSVIETMSAEQRMRLGRMISYFEMHMGPLRHILNATAEDDGLHRIYAEWAWSHFATLIMFGLAEMAVRHEQGITDGKQLSGKGTKIKDFFVNHLDSEEKESILKRYRQTARSRNGLIINTFEDVMDDMWHKIRSGFVHEGEIESPPLEGTSFIEAGEKEGVPVIALTSDIPVYEWLQTTWQAILQMFGYTDKIESEPIKRKGRL